VAKNVVEFDIVLFWSRRDKVGCDDLKELESSLAWAGLHQQKTPLSWRGVCTTLLTIFRVASRDVGSKENRRVGVTEVRDAACQR
jgi:hypothetical protein